MKKDPKEPLRDFAEELEKGLQTKARMAVVKTMTEMLSQGDLVVLSVMDIDGRIKILDAFIDQCTKLKEEIVNGS